MAKAFLSFILTLFFLLPSPSLAEGQATEKADSRSATHHGELLTSQIYGIRRFSLYSSEDETFTIQIERQENGQWVTEAINSSIQPWNNTVPTLSVIGEDLFLIKYIDLAYASIMLDASGSWRMTSWDVCLPLSPDRFFSIYPNSISIYTHPAELSAPMWIYGSLLPMDLESLDTSSLPLNPDDVKNLIDPDGWAVISSADETGIQAMYMTPDTQQPVLCSLYDGAPVKVIDSQQDWAKIEAAGLTGWVPQASVVTGFDMLKVTQRFPELCVWQEILTDEAAIYAAPTADSPVLYSLQHMDSSVVSYISVIGSTSDEWYAVFCPRGICGFMESKWFYAGNG